MLCGLSDKGRCKQVFSNTNSQKQSKTPGKNEHQPRFCDFSKFLLVFVWRGALF